MHSNDASATPLVVMYRLMLGGYRDKAGKRLC